MPQITKPMLAGKFDPAKARFPYLASPKIDGIRFLKVNGAVVSRSFKPIPNICIRNLTANLLPDGIDGELTCGDNFQESTSGIMSIDGKPDFKVWIFDYLNPDSKTIPAYYSRLLQIIGLMKDRNLPFKVEILEQVRITNMDELDEYESEVLNQGHEGVILRDPLGTYKFGRSTVNENILLKVKRFLDDEAMVVDIEEKMSNQNVAERDNFGKTKRSSAMDGLVGAGTTGALILERKDGSLFSCGSGLNDKMRSKIWSNQNQYIGKIVKYKYFPHGVKNLPRHPVFLGFRDPDDM